MQKYTQVLLDYYKQNPPNYGDADSILELLYWVYAECNPIDDQKIRDGFVHLRNQFPHLSLQEIDPILTTTSDLCLEYERLAFQEGLRLGVMLMQELFTGEGRS